MRLDLRKLRFRQPKLVATHLCLLFGSRESRHYVRANTFMGPDPSSWLKAGFAVVATDYQGLGTPGGHPYLATKPEGYSVLDSVRAVRDRNGLGDRALLVGQSQGAGAAFATAAVAASYAPDVKLIGTVATGLPY